MCSNIPPITWWISKDEWDDESDESQSLLTCCTDPISRMDFESCAYEWLVYKYDPDWEEKIQRNKLNVLVNYCECNP